MEEVIQYEDCPVSLQLRVIEYLNSHKSSRIIGVTSYSTDEGNRIRYTVFIEWGNLMNVFTQSTISPNEVQEYSMIIKDMRAIMDMKEDMIGG